MIYIIRHGESEAQDPIEISYVDQRKKRKPDSKIALTEKGVKQAKQAGKYFKTLKKYFYIVSSPYLRAAQTAKTIAKELDLGCQVSQNPLLSERNYGDARGYDGIREYLKWHPEEKKRRTEFGFLDYRPPRGESMLDVYCRAVLFATSDLNKPLIIVSHKNFCHMLYNYYNKRVPSKEIDWDNCEIRLIPMIERPLL